MGKVAAKVGSKVAPKAFPFTCAIKTNASLSKDASMATIEGAQTNAYTSVPCDYKRIRGAGNLAELADKDFSETIFELTIPVLQSDGTTRYDLDAETHTQIVVDAQSPEPSKTFRVLSMSDNAGVVWKIICTREASE